MFFTSQRSEVFIILYTGKFHTVIGGTYYHLSFFCQTLNLILININVFAFLQVQMQAQLLNCTAAILQVSEEDCAGISQLLFNLHLTVLCQNEETHGQVLASHCKVCN